MKAAAVSDYRELARRRLPRFLFDYVDGGAGAEVTLRRNVTDLEAVALRQRVLRDVSSLDLRTELFGCAMAMPIVLAPIGMVGLNARRGEVQAARAAERAGVPFCLSTVSTCSVSEVARGVRQPFWFQLYMIRDRGFMRALLAEAAAHCSVLLFTVDLPVAGSRYRDVRSGLTGAPGFLGSLQRISQALARPRWAWDVGLRGRPHTLGNLTPVMGTRSMLSDYFAWIRGNFDPGVTWKDIEWVRGHWPGPLVVKGILDIEDARTAANCGADGLVVSNHGGRQLDGTPSTAQALPLIAQAVGASLTVLVDGGVRSGLDVVRMLALGAKGVLLGRAWAYALAARGEAGVAHVLELIEAEMRVALSLTGCARARQITGELLVSAARA
ncbi:MAG TPA: FMN-dependent L-lactate dehydrogenase LldD [Steroidobacteraceae bacterium]